MTVFIRYKLSTFCSPLRLVSFLSSRFTCVHFTSDTMDSVKTLWTRFYLEGFGGTSTFPMLDRSRYVNRGIKPRTVMYVKVTLLHFSLSQTITFMNVITRFRYVANWVPIYCHIYPTTIKILFFRCEGSNKWNKVSNVHLLCYHCTTAFFNTRYGKLHLYKYFYPEGWAFLLRWYENSLLNYYGNITLCMHWYKIVTRI